jgi:hypothetical protein
VDYETRRLRNLAVQNTRTVPNRITAPGSGTEEVKVTSRSVLNDAPTLLASNTSASVSEYTVFGPGTWVDVPPTVVVGPVETVGPTVPILVVYAKILSVAS